MGTIGGYEPFVGQHCETTTTGNLMKAAGFELSEPMLFGLGQGLAYGVFVIKAMGAPFIGGRPRPEQITRNLTSHLGVDLETRQTRSTKRAWANIAGFVDAGQPVGVKVNMRHLDYFNTDGDFAGHYVAAYGYDEELVFVVDTDQQGGPSVTNRARFEEGRLWKGPMASNALTWTITVPETQIDLQPALTAAIATNMHDYQNPPIRNFGAKGIRKTAGLVSGWADTYRPEDLARVGVLMERAGTGGGLFRNFYADFLREANQHLNVTELPELADRFETAGTHWTEIAGHFEGCVTEGFDRLLPVPDLLAEIADLEEQAVADLARLFPTDT